MTLYATGMRRSELACLKVSDIDSQRMILRVVEGKGGKDRDLPISRTSLETPREYWLGKQLGQAMPVGWIRPMTSMPLSAASRPFS